MLGVAGLPIEIRAMLVQLVLIAMWNADFSFGIVIARVLGRVVPSAPNDMPHLGLHLTAAVARAFVIGGLIRQQLVVLKLLAVPAVRLLAFSNRIWTLLGFIPMCGVEGPLGTGALPCSVANRLEDFGLL